MAHLIRSRDDEIQAVILKSITTSANGTAQLNPEETAFLDQREQFLLRRLQQEKQAREKYKKSIVEYEAKERDFVSSMEAQMDQWEATEKAMTEKLKTFESENAKLQRFCDSLQEDEKETKQELQTLRQTNAETEKRVQFLMDRLVSLLSTEKSNDVEKELLTAMTDRETKLNGQMEKLKSELDQVRQQNRDFAVRLTEEQKLSAKLHTSFCDLQLENFALRGKQEEQLQHTSKGGAAAETGTAQQTQNRQDTSNGDDTNAPASVSVSTTSGAVILQQEPPRVTGTSAAAADAPLDGAMSDLSSIREGVSKRNSFDNTLDTSTRADGSVNGGAGGTTTLATTSNAEQTRGLGTASVSVVTHATIATQAQSQNTSLIGEQGGAALDAMAGSGPQPQSATSTNVLPAPPVLEQHNPQTNPAISSTGGVPSTFSRARGAASSPQQDHHNYQQGVKTNATTSSPSRMAAAKVTSPNTNRQPGQANPYLILAQSNKLPPFVNNTAIAGGGGAAAATSAAAPSASAASIGQMPPPPLLNASSAAGPASFDAPAPKSYGHQPVLQMHTPGPPGGLHTAALQTPSPQYYQEYISPPPQISSAQQAPPQMGGSGATIPPSASATSSTSSTAASVIQQQQNQNLRVLRPNALSPIFGATSTSPPSAHLLPAGSPGQIQQSAGVHLDAAAQAAASQYQLPQHQHQRDNSYPARRTMPSQVLTQRQQQLAQHQSQAQGVPVTAPVAVPAGGVGAVSAAVVVQAAVGPVTAASPANYPMRAGIGTIGSATGGGSASSTAPPLVQPNRVIDPISSTTSELVPGERRPPHHPVVEGKNATRVVTSSSTNQNHAHQQLQPQPSTATAAPNPPSRQASAPSQPSQQSSKHKSTSGGLSSKQKVIEMEKQLKEVLDSIAFDRAVIRVGNGLYNFGDSRCLLKLDESNRVVASSDGGTSFLPIAEYLKALQKPKQKNGVLNFQQPKLACMSIASPQLSATRMVSADNSAVVQPQRATSAGPTMKAGFGISPRLQFSTAGGVASGPGSAVAREWSPAQGGLRLTMSASQSTAAGQTTSSNSGTAPAARQQGPPVSQPRMLLNLGSGGGGMPSRAFSSSPLRTGFYPQTRMSSNGQQVANVGPQVPAYTAVGVSR
ncbi:unnamed protein product [Amoebophrya sp. A120]|nr:unnamed protein product [Amoebophrya sp. A120]|eukprot:GSA120T00008148001.1